MRLTDISIRALKPPKTGQKTHFDDTLTGFGVRVSMGGTKTFVLMHGRARSLTSIGRVGIITLAQARTKAKAILAEETLGSRTHSIKFEAALTTFLSTHAKGNRESTRKETKRLLERHFLAKLRHEMLSEISTPDIMAIVDKLADTPSEQNHAFAAARLFFRWATKRRYLNHSPLEGIGLPSTPKTKNRVLTNDELKAVWTAAGQCGTFGNIVRLLIKTGQRRGEIAALQPSWVNGYTVTLPANVTKNGREHTFPVTPDTIQLITGTSFNGWSKAKAQLDKLALIAPWTLHDLRRTFATNLAALGTPIHVTEKLLNHVSGSTGGIVSIYQRHAYMAEMRAAVELWEQKLYALIGTGA
ncbi:MAG TPA: tyrosine-type recombinase/integrase [Stellaceae bacterium]|jgi:integrase|nr:tyrosine-type recombinase/integrase [Stellaceae bacterium]